MRKLEIKTSKFPSNREKKVEAAYFKPYRFSPIKLGKRVVMLSEQKSRGSTTGATASRAGEDEEDGRVAGRSAGAESA